MNKNNLRKTAAIATLAFGLEILSGCYAFVFHGDSYDFRANRNAARMAITVAGVYEGTIKLRVKENGFCEPEEIPKSYIPPKSYVEYVLFQADTNEDGNVTKQEIRNFIDVTCEKHKSGELEEEIIKLRGI